MSVLIALLFSVLVAPAWGRQADRDPEAVSPLGRLLYSKPDNEDHSAAYEAVAVARMTLRAARGDREFRAAVLALGRALEGVWRYREAVSVYSRGLSRLPDDGELFLRRGTSSLRLRNFERALDDLRTAAKKLETNFESSYRLGLAQFLTRDFRRAGRTMDQAAGFASDDDELIAALHWSYASFRRAGRRNETEAALARVPAQMDLAQNTDYLRLIRMYRGDLGEVAVFDQDAPETERNSTRGFGVGHWHLAAGSEARAAEVLGIVVVGVDWPAIGVIAAEVELERLAR